MDRDRKKILPQHNARKTIPIMPSKTYAKAFLILAIAACIAILVLFLSVEYLSPKYTILYHPSVRVALRTFSKNEKNPDCLDALAVRASKIRDAILPMLRDSNGDVRYGAIIASAMIKEEKAIKILDDIIQKQHGAKETSASIIALAQINPTEITGNTRRSLLSNHSVVIAAAIESSIKAKDILSESIIVQLLSHNDHLIRYLSVKYLVAINTENHLDILIKCLSDKEAAVRQQAVIAVSRHKSARAEAALIPLLHDSSEAVRTSAKNALNTHE